MRALRFLLVPLPATALAASAPTEILPGEPDAPVRHEHAEILAGHHPVPRVASVRASAWQRDHEPFRTLDGAADSAWMVSGPPPAPMVRGNWIEIELGEVAVVPFVEVLWWGGEPYDYKVYRKPRDDFRELLHEGRSAGGDGGPERIDLPPDVASRVLRIEFATAPDDRPQGIREIRLGGLSFPEAYPQAADRFAPVEASRRIVYVEFERLVHLTEFHLGLPYADGGAGLRLLPRDDAFDGGRLDFTIATAPGRDNWISLRLWESREEPMMRRGDLIVLRTLDGDVGQRDRTFLPVLVTDEQITDHDWFGGPRPRAGRWSWAHYRVPADVVGDRSSLALRLQGVGNVRRDYPMRAPSPTIYSIRSSTEPAIR